MQPDRIKVGAGVILVSLDGLARDWGIPQSGVEKLLGTFKIPVIKLPEGEKRYLSLWSLEACLFEAGLPAALQKSPEAVQGLLNSAGLQYATATKEVIRERLQALQRALSKPGDHTRKSRKSKRGPGRPRKTWRESQN